ncbi:hypothetical protein HK102_011624 [Quaeritorhiza haematococci]|nr:hypothetical protein HK102_011624 [Quaeritorhiza haematococci]
MIGLYDDIMETLPAVQEANAIAEELKFPKTFELLINYNAGKSKDKDSDTSDLISIRVKDFAMHVKWIWSKSEFMLQRLKMQEMFTAYAEGGLEALSNWPLDRNPFETQPVDYMIGSVKVILRSLSYLIDVNETCMISDFTGANAGILRVAVSVAMKDKEGTDGQESVHEDEDMLAMSMFTNNLLLGKDLDVTITIHSAMGLRWSKGGLYCTYTLPPCFAINGDHQPYKHRTKIVPCNPSPDFSDTQQFTIQSATPEFVEMLHSSDLVVNIWGCYDKEKIRTTYAQRANISRVSTGYDEMGGGGMEAPSLSPVDEAEIRRQEHRDHLDNMRQILDMISGDANIYNLKSSL